MIGRRELLAGLGAGLCASPASARSRIVRPDFTGVWTNGSYTDLERPKDLKALILTPAEAEAYEKPRRALNGMAPSKDSDIGQAESEYNDRGPGLLRVRGQIRSSTIIDPPDGKIPYTAAAREEFQIGKTPRPPEKVDNPEDRPLAERCVFSPGSGAPFVAGPDTNHFRFVQTKDALAIWVEKYHDVRIIRLNETHDAARPPPPSWLGDSVGAWDGETLVVETIAFRSQRTGFIHLSSSARVVERFTRNGADEIAYEFTVTDPAVFTRPWRGESQFRAARGEVYEYACHEGNYGLPDILAAARHAEAAGK